MFAHQKCQPRLSSFTRTHTGGCYRLNVASPLNQQTVRYCLLLVALHAFQAKRLGGMSMWLVVELTPHEKTD